MSDELTQLKDRLRKARLHSDWLMLALNAVRHEIIARGSTEDQFAAMCDLTKGQLHDLIETHAAYLENKETNTKETP